MPPVLRPRSPRSLRSFRSRAALLAAIVLLATGGLVAGCDGSGGGGGGGGGTPTDPGPIVILTPDAGASPRIAMRSGPGSTGVQLEVELVAEGVDRLAGTSFQLDYPSDILAFDSYRAGPFLGGVPVVSQFGNRLIVILIGITERSGTGVLGSLFFTATESGTGRIEFVDGEATRLDGTDLEDLGFDGAGVRVEL